MAVLFAGVRSNPNPIPAVVWDRGFYGKKAKNIYEPFGNHIVVLTNPGLGLLFWIAPAGKPIQF